MSSQGTLTAASGRSICRTSAFLLYSAHTLVLCALMSLMIAPVWAATTVPMEVQMPGSQPARPAISSRSDKCDNCHQATSPVVNIAHDWRGSMMSHAGRDPLFWATVAIAEQDFDGVRRSVHSLSHHGRLAGGPLDTDRCLGADQCRCCRRRRLRRLPQDDQSRQLRTRSACRTRRSSPTTAARRPRATTAARSSPCQATTPNLAPMPTRYPSTSGSQSQFHRSVDFCGSCHDVSNPVVGDLAPNNGAQQPLAAGTFDGQLDYAVESAQHRRQGRLQQPAL